MNRISIYIVIIVLFSCSERSFDKEEVVFLDGNSSYGLTFSSYVKLLDDIMQNNSDVKDNKFYNTLLYEIINNSYIRTSKDGKSLNYAFNDIFIYIVRDEDKIFVYIQQLNGEYKRYFFPKLNKYNIPESFFTYFEVNDNQF